MSSNLRLSASIDTSPKTDRPLSYDIAVDTVVNGAKTRFGVKENSIKMLVDLEGKQVPLGGKSLWLNPYVGLQTDGRFENSDLALGLLAIGKKAMLAVG